MLARVMRAISAIKTMPKVKAGMMILGRNLRSPLLMLTYPCTGNRLADMDSAKINR
jgi:hypothetical protein